MQLHEDETPEAVNLRRLVAEQNAMLDERRRRIEVIEQQIDEYERLVHNDRCAQDGYDYLQRAYNLTSYNNHHDDFVNRCRQTTTEDVIAVYYRQASEEIRQRLVNVEDQLVDIAYNCRTIAFAECDEEKKFRQVDEFDGSACFDVDQKAQLVDDGSAHRRCAFQLDALRLELARADDIHQQQMVEYRRQSNAIEDANSQLIDEEVRLVAMLAASDGSSSSRHVSSNARKLFQPLKIKPKKFQTDKCQRHLEKDLQITRRSDVDNEVPDVCAAMPSTPGITGMNGCGTIKNDDIYTTSKSREIYTYSDIFASDSALEEVRRGSLPNDDDLFTDCQRMATFV